VLINTKVFFDLLCIMPQTENKKSRIVFVEKQAEKNSMQ
jgi:hypothetical protein